MPNTCYTIQINKEISLEDFVGQVNCGCTLDPVKEWEEKIKTYDLAPDKKLGEIIYTRDNQWYLKAGARFSAQANPEYIQIMLVDLSRDQSIGPKMTFTIVDSCGGSTYKPQS